MMKPKFSELSNEELLKTEKTLRTTTYAFTVIISLLFIVNIFLAFKKGFSAMNVIPLAFIPILIINIKSLKEMKKEIELRKL